jgi:hypothetical protein
MTETPQPNEEATPIQDEQRHDEPVSEAPLRAEDTADAQTSNRKQDTIRDEIRAGWCRALRRS